MWKSILLKSTSLHFPLRFGEGTDLAQLESELEVLFSTNFTREKWLVKFEDSEIEIVFDQGEVSAGAKDIPIQEFELELKQGFVADVLNLAKNSLISMGSVFRH